MDNSKDQCEYEGCQEKAYGQYTLFGMNDDGSDQELLLCWKHAEANGCCPVCGWHYGGGICQECIEANF